MQTNVLGGGLAPSEMPESWCLGILDEVLDRIEAGKSFACEARPARDDEWGVIKVSAMTWGEFQESEDEAAPQRNV
ncbi:hypothetical protein [Haloactinomyces albus]|uniref:Uncharacterized protein n=1 Tax=Haloactinomyces albus TaxID=1352928 RepID=A0AAE3ZB05_9ACTN|nr:hypothetical protein [Haloactinomyces albus]MDR7300615.1 hypothetical protein [Haloactinomyces albus]